MLIFVDYEHAEGRKTGWGQRNMAARTWITYRLEDLSGQHCMLVRYDKVTSELVRRLDATAIFISGNGSSPSLYDSASLEALGEIVRSSNLPMFGFCGGFQIMSQLLGTDFVPIDVPPGAVDSESLTQGADGQPFEFGYHPITLHESHPLFDGLADAPIFRHAHGLHVPTPPAGFNVLASTTITPIQLAVNEERKMLGTQFHPEYWTDEHPAGKVLIANFLNWAGL